MEFPVPRNLVVGLGLIGGSLALAGRRQGVFSRVVGWARTRATMERARAAFPGLRYYEIQTVLKHALGHVMKYHRFKFYTSKEEEITRA